MCGACLGLVFAGRVEHLVAAAGRPPALPRRPHRSLRRAWAWQGAVGGALSTVGGACTRGNAKKETHFSGWTACPAVNDAPDHAFCNPNAQHRPPLLSAMPCTAQVLPECTLPITGVGCVSLLITERAVFEFDAKVAFGLCPPNKRHSRPLLERDAS